MSKYIDQISDYSLKVANSMDATHWAIVAAVLVVAGVLLLKGNAIRAQ